MTHRPAPTTTCIDCGVDTLPTGWDARAEYYMVHDHAWGAAAMTTRSRTPNPTVPVTQRRAQRICRKLPSDFGRRSRRAGNPREKETET